MQEDDKVSEAVRRDEKFRKATNDGRSFKEVVEGLPHHLKVDDWVMKNPKKMANFDAKKNQMKLDKMNLKGMVWRVVEEIFNSTNMQEVKRKLGVVIEEVINTIHRDEDIMVELLDCRKEDEEPRMEGKDE